jgi:DNA gyrase subunit A
MADQDQKTTGTINSRNIVDEMSTSYINYAMSVIVARALPEVRDGLKPVQRRILYAMYRQGFLPSKSYKKSARTVGEVIGKYHPHGDTAVYDAMVRMAQDFSFRYPLIDGQGNFGSIDGDTAAAMRYTESRLGKNALEILQDLDKNTVDFIPTYDGSYSEPNLLPSLLPNLLLNGAEGIAVGMATKIPPHNLGEIIDGMKSMIEIGNEFDYSQLDLKYAEDIRTVEDLQKLPKNRFPEFNSSTTIEDLVKFIPAPDFPTGAEMYDQAEIIRGYATGRGRVLMRAVAHIEERAGGKFRIVVTELPYQVNKSNLVIKIADLHRDKKIIGIADLRDESTKTIRVVIDIKKDGNPNTVLNKLYKYTEMQTTFNMNLLALVNGEPKLLNLKRILELFITHRQEIIIRRAEFDLARAKEREHILEGLMIALDNLDEVINTIRSSKDADTAKTNLIKKFALSEIQATAILDMQLRKLAALERQKIEEEYQQIKKTIAELIKLITTPDMVIKTIDEELTSLKDRLSDKRRTKLHKGKVGEFSELDLIHKENVFVTVSEQGYIKRINENTYKQQKRGGKGKTGMGTKEDDGVSHILSCSTHDDILFFTNRGRVFFKKVYEIPEFGRTAKGQAIINLINIDQNELVTSILSKREDGKLYDEDTIQEGEEKREKKPYKYLFMATKLGTVKKTAIEDFSNIRTNGLISIKLSKEDELAWVKPTNGDDEVLLITEQARSIRFHEKDVRPTGRDTMGVRGILFKNPGDFVIAMDVVRKQEDLLLTISRNGYGKVSKLSQFPRQKRGGQGVYAARINKKTGYLATARIFDHPGLDLLIISKVGKALRTPTNDLPERSRQTAGVRLMSLEKGDEVSAIAIV